MHQTTPAKPLPQGLEYLPSIAPAGGPPMWDDCDAHRGQGAQIEPDWDLAVQPAPDYDVCQHVKG